MELMFHHLFSEDGDNRCLYCQGKCEFYPDGEGLYFIDRYACQNCQEQFSVHYMYAFENEPFGFGFSCNDLLLLHQYRKKIIIVALKGNFDREVEIPTFAYDFTNKDELYQKLKTLATFT